MEIADMNVKKREYSPKTGEALRPKKLAPDLRKAKPAYLTAGTFSRHVWLRLKEDSQFFRSTIQLAFAMLCVWIGIEFYLFVRWGASNGSLTFSERPPGVEGFLPIGALISVKYWWATGIINSVHPSGFFILLAIVFLSIAVKKAFCSWLCPIGTLSEALWILGRKMFGTYFAPPRWLDYPLRSLKYLLMAFFTVSVLGMDTDALAAFINSPYNKMADVKMYYFFAETSGATVVTIFLLMVASIFIKNFWCRYLCPYGALLGIAGWISPLKITRSSSNCIQCNLCSKACPANIAVHKANRVWSDECMSCLACVQVCPVKETLEVRARRNGRAVPSWVVGSLAAGIFVAVTGGAIIVDHWQSSIENKESLRRFRELNSPLYQHFRGQVPHNSPQD